MTESNALRKIKRIADRVAVDVLVLAILVVLMILNIYGRIRIRLEGG